MLTEAYLEQSQTSEMELFSLPLNVEPYFKTVLYSIELPLGSVCYTTHHFMKKLKTVKNSFVNNRTISFFRNSKLRHGKVSSVKKVFYISIC